MALTCGFFNSYKGDRKYDAEQMSSIFDGILKDGIIPSYGQLFDVNSAQNGMQVTVGTGRAWFNHTWTLNDSVKILNVPESDITRPRYDAVVLEVNHEQDVRDNDIKIVTGVPAVNAAKPTLVNTDKVKQYPLAYILVKAGVSEIKAEDIENMVGRTPTVFATGILETVAIDDLWSQWEGEWRTWFEGIKLQLSGDIVTNLQYQIDKLGERVDEMEYTLERTELVSRNLAKVKIRFTDTNGNPIENVFLQNFKKDYTSSDIVWSDANGVIDGYVPAGSFNASVSNFLDVTGGSTYTLTAGEKYSYDITLVRRNFASLSSGNWYSTGYYTKADVSLCGGGGGGGGFHEIRNSNGYYWDHGGGGGGGGYTSTGSLSIEPKVAYPASVASGGSGGSGSSTSASSGYSGGSSSFAGIIASGGGGGSSASSLGVPASGGYGNGQGGNGGYWISSGSVDSIEATAGSAGSSTAIVYSSYTTTMAVGGGGGGGGSRAYGISTSVYRGLSGAGGSPSGGGGGRTGSAYGGGGGGGIVYGITEGLAYDGCSGGRGYIGVRLHN